MSTAAPAGYPFFPDNIQFWYETKRAFGASSYGASEFGEVMATVNRIVSGDSDSWYKEWNATAERVFAEAKGQRTAKHRVSARDQSEYVSLLVAGAEKVLKDEGKNDLAAHVDYLFTTIDTGDAHTIGMVEVERNLARARVADADRILRIPTASRLDVEDALAVTLKKNGIELPRSFFTVMDTFKPKSPPQSE